MVESSPAEGWVWDDPEQLGFDSEVSLAECVITIGSGNMGLEGGSESSTSLQ